MTREEKEKIRVALYLYFTLKEQSYLNYLNSTREANEMSYSICNINVVSEVIDYFEKKY